MELILESIPLISESIELIPEFTPLIYESIELIPEFAQANFRNNPGELSDRWGERKAGRRFFCRKAGSYFNDNSGNGLFADYVKDITLTGSRTSYRLWWEQSTSYPASSWLVTS